MQLRKSLKYNLWPIALCNVSGRIKILLTLPAMLCSHLEDRCYLLGAYALRYYACVLSHDMMILPGAHRYPFLLQSHR
jgi:hypothetical protein